MADPLDLLEAPSTGSDPMDLLESHGAPAPVRAPAPRVRAPRAAAPPHDPMDLLAYHGSDVSQGTHDPMDLLATATPAPQAPPHFDVSDFAVAPDVNPAPSSTPLHEPPAPYTPPREREARFIYEQGLQHVPAEDAARDTGTKGMIINKALAGRGYEQGLPNAAEWDAADQAAHVQYEQQHPSPTGADREAQRAAASAQFHDPSRDQTPPAESAVADVTDPLAAYPLAAARAFPRAGAAIERAGAAAAQFSPAIAFYAKLHGVPYDQARRMFVGQEPGEKIVEKVNKAAPPTAAETANPFTESTVAGTVGDIIARTGSTLGDMTPLVVAGAADPALIPMYMGLTTAGESLPHYREQFDPQGKHDIGSELKATGLATAEGTAQAALASSSPAAKFLKGKSGGPLKSIIEGTRFMTASQGAHELGNKIAEGKNYDGAGAVERVASADLANIIPSALFGLGQIYRGAPPPEIVEQVRAAKTPQEVMKIVDDAHARIMAEEARLDAAEPRMQRRAETAHQRAIASQRQDQNRQQVLADERELDAFDEKVARLQPGNVRPSAPNPRAALEMTSPGRDVAPRGVEARVNDLAASQNVRTIEGAAAERPSLQAEDQEASRRARVLAMSADDLRRLPPAQLKQAAKDIGVTFDTRSTTIPRILDVQAHGIYAIMSPKELYDAVKAAGFRAGSRKENIETLEALDRYGASQAPSPQASPMPPAEHDPNDLLAGAGIRPVPPPTVIAPAAEPTPAGSSPNAGLLDPLTGTQGQTSANDRAPATVTETVPPSRKPVKRQTKPFDQHGIGRELLSRYDQTFGADDAALQAEGSYEHDAAQGLGAFANAMTWKARPGNRYPEEIAKLRQAHPELREVLRLTNDATRAGGEDAYAGMGEEKYVEALRSLAGRKSRIDTAKQRLRGMDPETDFLIALHDNLPLSNERVPQTTLDPQQQPVGTTFEINGAKFEIVEDEDGYRVLKDGNEYPVVPVDALKKVPVDKGTLKPGEEPPLPEGDFVPAGPTPPKAGGAAELSPIGNTPSASPRARVETPTEIFRRQLSTADADTLRRFIDDNPDDHRLPQIEQELERRGEMSPTLPLRADANPPAAAEPWAKGARRGVGLERIRDDSAAVIQSIKGDLYNPEGRLDGLRRRLVRQTGITGNLDVARQDVARYYDGLTTHPDGEPMDGNVIAENKKIAKALRDYSRKPTFYEGSTPQQTGIFGQHVAVKDTGTQQKLTFEHEPAKVSAPSLPGTTERDAKIAEQYEPGATSEMFGERENVRHGAQTPPTNEPRTRTEPTATVQAGDDFAPSVADLSLKELRAEAEKHGIDPDQPRAKIVEQIQSIERAADEVPPKGGTLDKLDQWAKGKLDELGGTGLRSGLGGFPFDPVKDPQRFALLAIRGAVHITKGIVKLAEWTKAMAEHLAGASEDRTRQLYSLSRRVAAMNENQRAAWVTHQFERGGDEPTKTLIRRLTGQVDTSKAVTELAALRASMKSAQRASVAGHANARDELFGLKRELVRIINDTLPLPVRGRMLSDVARIENMGHLGVALRRASSILADVDVEQALARVEKLTGKLKIDMDSRRPERSEADDAEALGKRMVQKLKQPPPLREVDLTKLEQPYREAVRKLISKARVAKGGLEKAVSIEDKYTAINALREIEDQIKEHVATDNAAKTTRIGEKVKQREAVVSALVKRIDPTGEANKGGPTAERPAEANIVRRLLGRGSLSMETIATHLDPDRGDFWGVTIDNVRKAQNDFYGEQRDFHNHMTAALDEAGIPAGTRKLDAFINDIQPVKLPHAGVVKMTRNHLVGLAAAAGDAKTRALMDAGVTWTFKGNALAKPFTLTEADIDGILGMITPAEEKLVAAYKTYNESKIAARLMQKSVELRGTAPDAMKGYFPRSRNQEQSPTEGIPAGWRGQFKEAVENIPALKERLPDLTTPLNVPEFIQDTYKSIDDSARVIHIAEPVRTAAMVLEDPRVKAAFEKKFGPSMNRRLDQFLEDTMMVRNREPKGGYGKAVSWLSRQVSRAWLQANPSPVLKNVIGGTISLLPEFEAADYAVGLKSAFSPKAFQELTDASGIAWRRYNGGLYGQYSPITGKHVETAAQLKFFEAVKSLKLGATVDAMQFMAWADSVPFRVAWSASKRFIDRTMPDATPEAKREAVLQKFHESVFRTQNGTSSTEVSGLGSDARHHPTLQAAMMFTSDANKKYNMLARLNSADAKTQVKTLFAVGLNALASAAVGYQLKKGARAIGHAIAGNQPNDDEREKARAGLFWDIARNIGGTIYFGDDLIEGARAIYHHQEPHFNSPPFEAASKLLEGLGRMAIAVNGYSNSATDSLARDKKLHQARVAAWQLTQASTTVAGIPLEPLMRLGKTAFDAGMSGGDPDPRITQRRDQTKRDKVIHDSLPRRTQELLREKNRLDYIGANKLSEKEWNRQFDLGTIEQDYRELLRADREGNAEDVAEYRRRVEEDTEQLQRSPSGGSIR